MGEPLAARTVGPLEIGVVSRRSAESEGVMKVPVAPESRIAEG